MRSINFLLLIAMLMSAIMVSAIEVRVFRLNYASPDSLATTIKALFGNQVNIAPAYSINAIAVSVSDKALLEEISKLVAVLDRRPANLRFCVQSNSQNKESSQFIGLQKRHKGRAETVRSTTNSSSQRTVVALEFAKASLTDELVQIYSLPGWYGTETILLTTSHGLKVSGHLLDNDRIRVQVWYSQGSQESSELLLTEVEAQAGEWFSLGGLDQSSQQTNSHVDINASTDIGHRKTGGQTDRRFMLKVDVIR
ncbi:MAG: hypothetical protein KKB51_10965 [Candidatus Riflebacteria bacterium]|nr:hypothetical protein [Candidatus Riflebacteria bacterium]